MSPLRTDRGHPMPRLISAPVIVCAADPRVDLGGQLEHRFGVDYEVVAGLDEKSVLAELERAADDARPVALVIAGVRVGGSSGAEILRHVRGLHPQAVRCLLAPMVDREAAELITEWTSLDLVDHYLSEPWGHPEVGLYPHIGAMLGEWRRDVDPESGPVVIEVIAPPLTAETYELRDLLARNGVPARFHEPASPTGVELLDAAGVTARPHKLVVTTRHGTLVNPDRATIAHHLGAATRPREASVDVAVVGGGPAGLSAAVYGSSEGLRTAIIERSAIGGQAGTSSHIRNYLGFANGISGAELASRASEQAWQFGTEFILVNPVTGLTRSDAGGWRLEFADGATLDTRVVILATGVDYRRLDADGVERLLGAGVFYGSAVSEARAFAGKQVYIVGAGNNAGQAALHLAKHAAGVTVLARGPSFAAKMSDYLVRQLTRTSNVTLRTHTAVEAARGEHHLETVVLDDTATGRTEEHPADGLFVMIGAVPDTDWLPQDLARDLRGFLLTGGQVLDSWEQPRQPLPFETSLPGVFAVGDVRAGSVKRVASAVGEGSVCVWQVHQFLAATNAPEEAT